MLPKYLFYLAFGTLLLSGCGLDTDDDDEDETSYVEVVVEQNEYLPLTNATRFFYSATNGTIGGLEAAISYDVSLSNNKGYPVHKVAIGGDDLTLDLYFRSTSSQITLIGIDGPVDVSGAAIDYLRFATPISLIGNRSNQSTTATADIQINGSSLSNPSITIDYDVTNDKTKTFNNSTTVSGDIWRFPTLKATLDAEITVSGSGITLDPIPITLEFDFTKGLGLVQHSGNLTGNSSADYEVKFDHLVDLPNIMVFDNDANGDTNTFTLADGSDTEIAPSEYKIVNLTELSDLGWVEIAEENSDTFSIDFNTSHEDFPDSLTSIQVLFENRVNSGERLSANVTILEP